LAFVNKGNGTAPKAFAFWVELYAGQPIIPGGRLVAEDTAAVVDVGPDTELVEDVHTLDIR